MRFLLVQFIIHSDSPGYIFILHWAEHKYCLLRNESLVLYGRHQAINTIFYIQLTYKSHAYIYICKLLVFSLYGFFYLILK